MITFVQVRQINQVDMAQCIIGFTVDHEAVFQYVIIVVQDCNNVQYMHSNTML